MPRPRDGDVVRSCCDAREGCRPDGARAARYGEGGRRAANGERERVRRCTHGLREARAERDLQAGTARLAGLVYLDRGIHLRLCLGLLIPRIAPAGEEVHDALQQRRIFASIGSLLRLGRSTRAICLFVEHGLSQLFGLGTLFIRRRCLHLDRTRSVLREHLCCLRGCSKGILAISALLRKGGCRDPIQGESERERAQAGNDPLHSQTS